MLIRIIGQYKRSDRWYIFTSQGVNLYLRKALKAYYMDRNEEIRILCGSL